MRQVWKFGLDFADWVVAEIPRGAEILHVDVQHGRPCIWALVDPDAPTERRTFFVRGTGHPIDDRVGEHVGSFLVHDGDLVFHVFEADYTRL